MTALSWPTFLGLRDATTALLSEDITHSHGSASSRLSLACFAVETFCAAVDELMWTFTQRSLVQDAVSRIAGSLAPSLQIAFFYFFFFFFL